MALFIHKRYDYSRRKTRSVVGLFSDQFIDLYLRLWKKSVGICFEHTDLPKSCERQCPIEKRLIVISFRIYESSECFGCESPAQRNHRAKVFFHIKSPYGFGRDLNCNYRRRAGRWQKREADCRRLRELIAKAFRASEGGRRQLRFLSKYQGRHLSDTAILVPAFAPWGSGSRLSLAADGYTSLSANI